MWHLRRDLGMRKMDWHLRSERNTQSRLNMRDKFRVKTLSVCLAALKKRSRPSMGYKVQRI